MVQVEHATDVAHLHLALDERRSDDIHIGLHLRLGIRLQDVLLDVLHIAHERGEFDRTAVEPLAERSEGLGVDGLGLGEQLARLLADGLDVGSRTLRVGGVVLGVSHRCDLSRSVYAFALRLHDVGLAR